MNIVTKLLSLLLLISYNEKLLMKSTAFKIVTNFFSFLIVFFIKLSTFYWEFIFKSSKLFKEFFFVNSFLPNIIQYLYFLNLFFDIIWFYYLYFVVTVLIFSSVPYFIYFHYKNKAALESSEKKYKLFLILTLFVMNSLQNALIIVLVILFFEIHNIIRMFRLVSITLITYNEQYSSFLMFMNNIKFQCVFASVFSRILCKIAIFYEKIKL
jgi:hypothetical protein